MGQSGRHVVVVGGGISGLAAAHALAQLPVPPRVTVLEAGPRIGGKLALATTGGVALDAGAESVLARRPEAVDLIAAVGLAGDVVTPARGGASVLVDGTLRPVPQRQVLGIPYDLEELAASGILSLRGLLRVPLDQVRAPSPVDADVAIGTLVADRLGREVVDRLVEPLLGGVYAGHADALSLGATLPELLAELRHGGGLLDAVARTRRRSTGTGPVFASLRGGLGRLPEAVAGASGATVVTGAPVEALEPRPSGWRVHAEQRVLDADAVVLAVPAPALAQLVGGVAPDAAADLADVDYASVALVTLVFPRTAFAALPEGTGFLVPPQERRVVKAVTYSSLKWGWLAEQHPDAVVLRASVGRHGDEADLLRDDADLAWAVLGEVCGIVGVTDAPVAHRVTRWDRALPQYAVGHPQRVERVRGALDGHRGLAVCGAALDGVGIPACIASGQRAAARVAASMGLPGQ